MSSTLSNGVTDCNITTRMAVKQLRKRDVAVCRVDAKTKRPTYQGWNTRSLGPKDFGPEDLIGIVCGPLSTFGSEGCALVVIDLDHTIALHLADQYLPITATIEGRESRPRSHRYYLVKLDTIPDWARSTAAQAATAAMDAKGHPGPFTKSFRHAHTKAEVLKFIATGGQVVCPPSLHTSGERREWEGGEPGQPTVLDFLELWEAVCRLASECGCQMPSGLSWPWEPPPESESESEATIPPSESEEATFEELSPEEIQRRAIGYLDACPSAVSGKGGHDQTFAVARAMAWGFNLGEEGALKIMQTHYNPRCSPPWEPDELRHKCHDAATQPFDKPKGYLLKKVDRSHRRGFKYSRCHSTPGSNLIPGGELLIEASGTSKHQVTVRISGTPVFVDTANLANAKSRGKLLDDLMEKCPDADRTQLEAELLRRAAPPPEASPESSQELKEVDILCVIRPELFHTSTISGITIPVMFERGGTLVSRWRTHIRWASGERSVGEIPKRVALPDGSVLHVQPDPGEASSSEPPQWSSASRSAWLGGGKAPDPVQVYEDLCCQISRYLEFPPDVAAGTEATVALWVMMTYFAPVFPAVPYLSVGGTLGSGKSRLLDVIQRVAFRPMVTSNLTGPTLFRSLHINGGTLIIDEAERLRSTHDPAVNELLSVLLAGYRRGGTATRLEIVGESYQPLQFQVFGPKALAAINGLPPALASRCIPITMFRAASDSPKPKMQIDGLPQCWRELRDDLHVLALEHGPNLVTLPERRNVLPTGISGRAAEVWQPILALAAWIEKHGETNLLSLVQNHALGVLNRHRDDEIPEADEILLELLAEAVGDCRAPTSAELLRDAKERDEQTFHRWHAKTVATRLKTYGIATPKKIGGQRRYRDVTPTQLNEIGLRYGIDLEITAVPTLLPSIP